MATEAESSSAEKEAQEFWGYLFKADKTGTDKLKNLLRGLHHLIGTKFESYDSSDLTPSQLARFYKELNGNYDPLFLQTPPATVAFIYKNLGCIHSLQPLPGAAAESRFTEPTIPSLKVEGWIMWETIQLLLGPEEHAGFLMKAVKKWDVKDPDTGDVFPSILPRSAFPSQPDAHMVAWYEGVSERLRREAEEEQRMRITAVDEEPNKQIEAADRHHRKHDHHHSHPQTPVEEEVPDSRRSAIAYFRNPLFRKEDGRPGVVRRDSKHPTLKERGKSAASSMGRVMRDVASPSLWDGGNSRERERERDRDKDKDKDRHRDRSRRRRSLQHHHLQDAEAGFEDDVPSPRLRPRNVTAPLKGSSMNHSPTSDRDSPDSDASPRYPPSHHHHRHHSSPYDHTVRHSKSHDPTPSPKDYFPPYSDNSSRRGSYQSEAQSPKVGTPARSPMFHPGRRPSSGNDNDVVHSGFMPTASPLFATQIARNEYRTGYFGQPAMTQLGRRQGGPSNSSRSDQAHARASSMSRPEQYKTQASGPSSNNTVGQPPRPKVTRFDTPVQGVHGRQFVKEGPWK